MVVNGLRYGADDIANLPMDLTAYRAAEKSNDTHLVFAGELRPYSNFHPSPFIIMVNDSIAVNSGYSIKKH